MVEDVHLWLTGNLKAETLIRGFKWCLIFAVAILFIWLARNDWVFNGKRPSGVGVGKKVLCQVAAILACYDDSKKASLPIQLDTNRSNIRWVAPYYDFVKFNVDGAVTSHGNSAAAGGVLRNDRGAFILGFASHLGSGTTTEAKLEAIFIGISLSIIHGLKKVILESDSLVAVKLIGEGCHDQHPYFNLLREIRSLLLVEEEFYVTHTLREGNQVADSFAKFRLSLNNCSTVFRIVPAFASLSLQADMAGTCFPRSF